MMQWRTARYRRSRAMTRKGLRVAAWLRLAGSSTRYKPTHPPIQPGSYSLAETGSYLNGPGRATVGVAASPLTRAFAGSKPPHPVPLSSPTRTVHGAAPWPDPNPRRVSDGRVADSTAQVSLPRTQSLGHSPPHSGPKSVLDPLTISGAEEVVPSPTLPRHKIISVRGSSDNSESLTIRRIVTQEWLALESH